LALLEWPVHAENGFQVLSGRLDLLVDLGDGYAIIDHNSSAVEGQNASA